MAQCAGCAAYLRITSPVISLENASHKPSLATMAPYLSETTPIALPDAVWNSKRENLPLTLQLRGFDVRASPGGGRHLQTGVSVTSNLTSTH